LKEPNPIELHALTKTDVAGQSLLRRRMARTVSHYR